MFGWMRGFSSLIGRQSQSVAPGGVAAQVLGNNNTLLFAAQARLEINRRHRLKARAKTERDLLMTERQATALVGRATDLKHLHEWLNLPQLIAVRLLTGRAGAGKTRVGIELCEQAETAGWIAGFAGHDALRRFHDLRDPAEWHWQAHT